MLGHFSDQLNFTCEIFVESDLLPRTVLIPLGNVLVSSWLDYCNSLVIGINNSAQTISGLKFSCQSHTKTPKYEHVTPILRLLYCLPIQQTVKIIWLCCYFNYVSLPCTKARVRWKGKGYTRPISGSSRLFQQRAVGASWMPGCSCLPAPNCSDKILYSKTLLYSVQSPMLNRVR